ncbi:MULTISPECIES: hypothetical protein [unclassified Enterobacter cloacae complex]|uniref:hypothetical protein n=1 Tax=unclassified Enterobacter cloacae complex TaxID=2757714 RepID=UPI001873D03C|nr:MULTISPECIES: hypothetical protein [unclassified Enterobacter cloacae complex]MBE4946319.1 hypothetical protein [Enterobacter cloacae complex sp. P1B]MBE4968687.1 hypothetical protein [Enterobacter cloacae complex sp. P11RS]
MDESRKQFERWINSLPMCSAERHRIDNDRYRFNTTEVAWKSWQASRAAIEIKLPPKAESSPYEHYMPHYTMDADSVESAIRAAGIKVKE